MRQRLSMFPGERARYVGHLKVFVGLRLVLAGFEIEEAEGDPASESEAGNHGRNQSSSTIGAPRRASMSSPCLKPIRNPPGVGM